MTSVLSAIQTRIHTKIHTACKSVSAHCYPANTPTLTAFFNLCPQLHNLFFTSKEFPRFLMLFMLLFLCIYLIKLCVCVNLDLSPVQLCSLTDRCVRVCRRAGAFSAAALTLPAQFLGLRKTSSGSANGGNNGGLSTAVSNHFNSLYEWQVLKDFLDKLSTKFYSFFFPKWCSY